MDYSKTLNLPESNFPMKTDPASMEMHILDVWSDLTPYEARQKNNKEKPEFIIYSLPLPVRDSIHLDNALDAVLRDILTKYKLMCGYSVPYCPDWNCYSISIEREALKFLDEKDEVKRSKLQKHCRDICSEYVDKLKAQYQRLGIFAHWDKSVLTSDSDYRAGVINIFADLYEAGYLYQGARPTRWCINCRMDLTESETLYKPYEMLSLYVKFPVIYGLEELGEDVYMVVQTNTPWTLPANTSISVHPDRKYVAVELESREVLIMSDTALSDLSGKILNDPRVIREMDGLELEKIIYAHPFLDRNSNVFLDRTLSMTNGTGCVHTVPESGSGTHAHQGAENISTVDRDGKLTGEAGRFCGLDAFESIDLISLELEKKGCLLAARTVEQNYPYCSYCGEPTIFRLINKWIFNLNANDLRQRILKSLKEIQWFHESSKVRNVNVLNGRLDWSISCHRSWGVPVPVFYCDKCGSQADILECINASRDMIGKRGASRWFSAKPVDILPGEYICSKCGGRDFQWKAEVLDDGFVSALSCVINSSIKNKPQPSIDVCMGSRGQDENSIQLSLLPAVAVDDCSPFKAAFVYDATVKSQKGLKGQEDQKPKSGDNGAVFSELLENHGADVLRFWMSSRSDRKGLQDTDSHLEEISIMYQRIRNTCRFLLSNLSGYDPENDRVDYEYLQGLDRWALHRLAVLMAGIKEAFEGYHFHRLHRLFYDFCSSDMGSLYLSMVKRRLYINPRWSGSRRAAQTVIYEVLTALVRAIAPILPFTAEEIWRQLPYFTEDCPSVFLADWPELDEAFLDYELEARCEKLMEIRSEIYRSVEDVRQSEDIDSVSRASVILYATSPDVYALLDRYIDDLEEIFMVSKVRLMPPDSPIPDGINNSRGVEGLAIEVRNVAGEKCERCWIYSDTVGTNERYPTLCYRCITILEGGAHYI